VTHKPQCPEGSLLLPVPLDGAAVAAALGPGWAVECDRPTSTRVLCADSFDWRLYEAGLHLVVVERRGALQWALSGAGVAPLVIDSPRELPARFDELPTGALREAIAGPLAPRALLARAVVHRVSTACRLRDEEGKLVVRLAEESGAAAHPDEPGDRRPLPQLLLVEPLKGYEAEAARLRDALIAVFGATPTDQCLCEMAYRALDLAPGGYTPRIRVTLDPAMAAHEATRRIHLQILDTLEANVEGAVADLDAEFLHDLRVSVRRSRAALSQVKGVFPAAAVARFREGFGWLGKITGPKRDLDVFLLGMPEYLADVPEELRNDLEAFRAFLLEEHAREGRTLAQQLGSVEFRALLQDWRAFLEAPGAHDAEVPNARLPVGDVANARIWRAFRRVLKEGRAIDDASPPPQLHELRKDCKKLRYLLELFGSLYPADRLDALIKALKSLLDTLGAYQDLAVQAHHLEAFAEQMAAAGKAPARTLLALGALVGRLLERRSAERADFAARFAAFDTDENRASYRSLFKPVDDRPE
jgi:CHAD domain-containing protein